jgi:predicted dehydrogenase
MLESDIDVVCICTPSYFHAENAILALKCGKHAVVEKPMALNVADADRVIAAAEQYGKLVSVISQFRFSEDIAEVKRAVEDGLFGKISLCTLTMKYYRSEEYYSSSNWKGTLKYDGGGALINQGIHGVDLVQYVMGGVKSSLGRVATRHHNIEAEDTAVATVEYECGALGTIVASTCATPGFDRKLEIHGDKGYAILTENNLEKLVIDGKEIEVGEREKSNTSSDPTAVASLMHQRQIENLIRAINGEEEIFIDCNEGKKAVKIITDIYKE